MEDIFSSAPTMAADNREVLAMLNGLRDELREVKHERKQHKKRGKGGKRLKKLDKKVHKISKKIKSIELYFAQINAAHFRQQSQPGFWDSMMSYAPSIVGAIFQGIVASQRNMLPYQGKEVLCLTDKQGGGYDGRRR